MLFTLQTIVMVMCVRNHAGYEKMKHGILCLILLLHETENSMCHLLCLAVLLYSALPPAEIWANKLCCHLKQGVSCFFLWCFVISVVEGETLILKPLVVLCLKIWWLLWSVCDVVMI
jgi:hypothetical protein